MTRTYTKKTQRAEICEDIIKRTLTDVFNNTRCIRNAAEVCQLKRQTLQSRINKILRKMSKEDFLGKYSNEDSGQESEEITEEFSSKYAARKIFSTKEEELRAIYHVRQLAFEYGSKLKKEMPKNGMFDQMAVPPPPPIFNLDECGVTTVLKPTKIVAENGKKQIGISASSERGEHVTFVGIVNASGGFFPPVYVYPRLRRPEDYLVGGISESLALGSKSCWMTSDISPQVLKHISKQVNPSKENKILLLLGNHDSHRKPLSSSIISIIYYTPTATTRCWRVFPFQNKTSFSQPFHNHILSNPGRKITISDVVRLSKTAVLAAFTPNIANSFEKTGLRPMNTLIFTESDFKPSLISTMCSIPAINSLTTTGILTKHQNVVSPDTYDLALRLNNQW
ncbi:hypothetical protein PR048_007989 [Dryococelus australis]|uniref:DDE-1 domain-containing protein n=1 Tax=Dryococelus australis TaxID=614101 RepID=A0ABQ9HVT5_9NEOP|nr:hypothetical protein PR048_007989 [Dryococelus australis]